MKIKLELRGAAPGAKAPLFRDFAPEFLKAMQASNKPSEIQSKESILRLWLTPELGPLRLDETSALTRKIDALKVDWLAVASPKTCNNRLTVLGKLFSVAKDWGLIATSPKIRWCRTEAQEMRFYTFEESERLLAAAEPGFWRTMILTALRTGLRRGELLALRWDDANLLASKITVRRSITRGVETDPKGRRSRDVPISPELSRALGALYQKTGGGKLVFPGPGGRHLTKGELRWPLRRACRAAGLDELGWHALRHSFASHLVMKGVPLKAVQQLLGHAQMSTTMVYAHLAPVMLKDAVALLDGGKG